MIRPGFAVRTALALCCFLVSSPVWAQNEIANENALPGNPPSEWDVVGAGDSSIQGFTTDISVDQGGTVSFKVSTDATDYRLEIYRMGYYGGLGARRVATVQPSATLPQVQPTPISDPTTGLVDCGNWAVSATWNVPANAVSGVYVAKLVREVPADGGASHVIFVVRDDDGNSELLFQTNDATWQAYNTYGGNSLYLGSPAGRAYKVSYNRPLLTRCCDFPNGAIVSQFFAAQYPMVRWLEANGYDVSYTTCADSDRRGAEIPEHEVFLSVGHDEYWSAGQRANVEAARDAGMHLAFFSGNEVFWKTRWESSIDGAGTPHRTLVCYKETHANAKIDPLPNVWTGTWRDPRFSPPADGGRPENALLGTIFTVNGIRNDALQVPEADGKLRLWRNTSVATLTPGQVATFGAGTLGFEWDEDLDNGFRPAGLVRFSTTTVSGVPLLQDYGSNYASGTATHHVLMHRRPNGAYVFSAGTVQWSWGLDATHDKPGPAADLRIQQATTNLFADLGVQPGTLQPGLVAAAASTDGTDPVSVIVSPSSGSSVTSGVTTVVAGTASDQGGRVGGIEISVDAGATWHPAEGRETWSFVWVPEGTGTATILTRAVDDSGNLENPGTGVVVNIEPFGSTTCPCHIFSVAGGPAANDPASVEVGVRFRADREGTIDGVRFYKPSAATGGVHVGNLWSNDGVLLRSVVFQSETDSGWQEALFAEGEEVPISSNTLYVSSVFMPQGRYAATNAYFATAVDNPPLHAPADGAEGFPNGVFGYGTGGFPTNSFQSTNYWVDVVFDTLAVLPPCLVDQVSADFALGTFGGGAYASETEDGEITLAPATGAEFFGATLPVGWSSGLWGGSGIVQIAEGALTLDGARLSADAAFSSGRSLEFIATFTGQPFQHVGLSAGAEVDAPWALFSTGPVGGALYARTSSGSEQLLPGSWLGAPHRYLLSWQPGGFEFSIDGTPIASIPFTVTTTLRPVASDLSVGSGSLTLDWIRLRPYSTTGTYTSRVVGAGFVANWETITWGAETPSGTSVLLFVRTGPTPVPGGSWSTFTPVGNGGSVDQINAYIQYRVNLSTADPNRTPTLGDVTIECSAVSAVDDSPGAAGVPSGATVRLQSNPVTSRATFELTFGPNETAQRLGPARITIYDVGGRMVRELERVGFGPGLQRIDWDLTDQNRRRLAPGVYYYRANLGSVGHRGELVIVR